MDADFGQHVQRELSGEPAPSPQIPATDSDSAYPEEEFGDPGSALNENSTYYQQQQLHHHQEESHISPEPTTVTVVPATIALVIAED